MGGRVAPPRLRSADHAADMVGRYIYISTSQLAVCQEQKYSISVNDDLNSWFNTSFSIWLEKITVWVRLTGVAGLGMSTCSGVETVTFDIQGVLRGSKEINYFNPSKWRLRYYSALRFYVFLYVWITGFIRMRSRSSESIGNDHEEKFRKTREG